VTERAISERCKGAGCARLATALQNQFAILITFPLQNITPFGVGPDDGRTNELNLQPVVPIRPDDGAESMALVTLTFLFPE
jgi:hypothetical protein